MTLESKSAPKRLGFRLDYTGFVINEIAATPDVFDIQFGQAPKRHAHQIQVGLRQKPPLPLEGSLIIKTDCSHAAQIHIPFSVDFSDPIVVTPAELLLLNWNAGPVDRQVVLRSGDGKPFEILSLHAKGLEAGQTRSESLDGGRVHKIFVEQVQLQQVLEGSCVEVETGLAGAERIKIPFRIVGASAVAKPEKATGD